MNIDDLADIERKIVIGMITRSDFLEYTELIIDTKWVQSREARLLMSWVLEYFRKYKKAPGKDIQDIYINKLQRKKVSKEQAEVIETILESLSDESENDETDLSFLKDQTELYAKACKLNQYKEEIEDQLERGDILDAENLILGYKPVEVIKSRAVIPLGDSGRIKSAFNSLSNPLIKYPGDLGRMINPYMVKEGFVIFLGQNKGGKSLILMDAAIRAAEQKKKVVLFQGGDMSEEQMERRMAIYFSKRSDLPKYCGALYIPVLDCVYNQNGACERDDREGGTDMEGPFEGDKIKTVRERKFENLISAYKEYSDHIPCYNCLRNVKKRSYFIGCIWYKKRGPVEPLTWKDTYRTLKKKWGKVRERIRLITYPSEGLTTSRIRAELDILDKSGFESDIQIIDYFDLLGPDNDCKNLKPRDQRNKAAARLRGLSQERKSLVLSASQSDTQGFNQIFLDKRNFNEDRRILDHVTAIMGLNMTIDEKKKGIMRINDIASRDTEGTSFAYVLHRLQIGRPILGSFF